MTRTFVLAIAGTVIGLSSSPAFSQDWSGLYAGVHAGYAFGDTDWDYQLGGTADHDIDGPAGGFQAGYNLQSGSLVYGAEIDATLNTADGSTDCPNPAFSCESELGLGGSARLKAGFASGSFLIYGTGGAALSKTTIQTISPGGQKFDDDSTEFGWTAGAGIEYLWSPHISTRLEYRYTDLGSSTYTVDNNLDVDADIAYHTVFFGVNWHF